MSDFEHEFNNEGRWSPCLIVESSDHNNAFVLWVDLSDATWHTASAKRGDDAGEFRERA